MSLEVIHVHDVVRQPWRNGGGLTRELWTWPSAEGWWVRVSVADIREGRPVLGPSVCPQPVYHRQGMAHMKPLFRNIAAVAHALGTLAGAAVAATIAAWLGSRRALMVKDGALL
jgi:hypothetical protein